MLVMSAAHFGNVAKHYSMQISKLPNIILPNQNVVLVVIVNKNLCLVCFFSNRYTLLLIVVMQIYHMTLSQISNVNTSYIDAILGIPFCLLLYYNFN